MRLPQNTDDISAPAGGSQFEPAPNAFDRDNFDNDDEDFQADEPLGETGTKGGVQRLHPSDPYLQQVRPNYPVHYSHSDKEVRSGDTLRLVKANDKVGRSLMNVQPSADGTHLSRSTQRLDRGPDSRSSW
ncbi:unnamed protein product [Dibothriocephalus latus]|uniref:Uncharacterized protein n=1 Tax=Dibothriocephalus latus TaxID=60516 RepID=A0A3P6QH00_DIBLA|nr:unnamed protein product [Dibothriocephalus latus]